MSSAANIVEFPVRHGDGDAGRLERDVVLALATADDLAAGIDRVMVSIVRSSGANSVEWWTTDEDGEPRLDAAIGIARGTRHELPLGGAGLVVLHGGGVEPHIASALAAAAPIVRRRAAEERLARTAVDLVRRNQALEDFAALVAHELKTPLHAALLAGDPSRYVADALDLVESLLEAAHAESADLDLVSAAESVEQAVADLGADVEVTTDLQATLPVPPEALRVILRNLLSNAVAAGARHVHVAAVHASRSWRLLVDDDGVGLAQVDRYAAGSGLGLSLIRRIAERLGGGLELEPRPSGGTRAALVLREAAR
jgi:signal transduction histidine kinase